MRKLKPVRLFIDQDGNKFYARTIKELRSKIGNGGSRVSKMYVDGKDGVTYHIGYIVGEHWLEVFTPMRIAVPS